MDSKSHDKIEVIKKVFSTCDEIELEWFKQLLDEAIYVNECFTDNEELWADGVGFGEVNPHPMNIARFKDFGKKLNQLRDLFGD